MARFAPLLVLLALLPAPAAARDAVWASEPQQVSVTVYRDPARSEGDEINRDYPQGFALISETRTVTLAPGENRIRFDGVSEGMIAVSAIVTGLPGGTIEKNRNADLLSPASLVDGTLGNRVTITRTNPATGAPVSEDAIVRTRADGGLVLQSSAGYEAVRCSGLPERLTFDGIPDGLSARPVYSIDTSSPAGGTYEVVLTYLSWGFDWQAHYVASFNGTNRRKQEQLAIRSWLTLVNDNGQSFENADLNVVAGRLNVVSDFEELADSPEARGLYLTCYPIGSTAAGSPIPYYNDGWSDSDMRDRGSIVVTGQRLMRNEMASASPIVAMDAELMKATEESLGDLKLYRVPVPVTVASKGMKQVAFLDKDKVTGRLVYEGYCSYWNAEDIAVGAQMKLETVNDEEHGLGAALPMGAVTMFERGLLVGEEWLRDHAEGQDVEIDVARSSQVFVTCSRDRKINAYASGYPWQPMKLTVTNANPRPVTVKLRLGAAADWRLREKLKGLVVDDGELTIERTIPANSAEDFAWTIRLSNAVSDGE